MEPTSVGPAYVQASVLVCAMLAFLFAWVRWRHRDPGMRWFAVGFLCIALIFALGLRPPIGSGVSHRGASMLAAIGAMSLGFGMVDYIGTLLAHPARWRIALVLPPLLALAWLPFGPLPRLVGHAMIALSLGTIALMAWLGARREPGAGLRLISAALLLHPITFIAMALAGVETYELRNMVIVPICVFGASLFAISLTRTRKRLEQALQARVQAQAALEQLNESLEHRVAQRTGELHEMVVSLECFSRSVSHYLRGPLGGVASLTRIAIDAIGRGETERAMPMLEAIATQADNLGRLVDDLLTLARATDAPIARDRIDLRDCIDAATDQLRLSGQPVDAVDAGALGGIEADPGLMRQVFVNLIGNALKFSRGAARPQVRVERLPDADRVIVAVRDNGAGFAPEHARDLFEPFRRLHSGYEGTGLGLTIVRRIVERHGGSVWAEGQPGAGASFYVCLPGPAARGAAA